MNDEPLEIPPQPPDRPGYINEIILWQGRPIWRQRKMDKADYSLLAFYEQERTAGAKKPRGPWNWARMARRDPVTGETDVERAARYRREFGLRKRDAALNGEEMR